MGERDHALINGALVFHWILELHRAVPGPYALIVEVVLVIVSAGLLVVGIWRETHARR